jgi:Flp pilus assembly protein TadD
VDLLKAYSRAGDKPRQIEILKDLVPTDPDDVEQRKRLARMLIDAGRYGEAERFAREALEIDVRDAEAQQYLDNSLRHQGKTKEAETLRRLLAN